MENEIITVDTLCTYNLCTDKYTFKIVSIPRKNQLTGHIYYSLDNPDTFGKLKTFTKRKDGHYYEKGQRNLSWGHLTFGEAINFSNLNGVPYSAE